MVRKKTGQKKIKKPRIDLAVYQEYIGGEPCECCDQPINRLAYIVRIVGKETVRKFINKEHMEKFFKGWTINII